LEPAIRNLIPIHSDLNKHKSRYYKHSLIYFSSRISKQSR